jgi:hypothetical protein
VPTITNRKKVKPTIHPGITLPTKTKVTLPDGRKLVAGDLVTIDGVDGTFRFKYVRNGDITVYGGTGAQDKGYQQWRTFKPHQVGQLVDNPARDKQVAIATAGLPDDRADWLPWQKALYTWRINQANKILAAAA